MANNDKTAYVLLKGGIYQPVENYHVAFETDVNDYLPGDTFRNDWTLPAAIRTLAATATGTNFYYPPGTDFTEGAFSSYNDKPQAYLPDPVAGVAPRDVMVKQTRLRFFAYQSSQLTAHVVDGEVTMPGSPWKDGDIVSLNALRCYVINAAPGGFGLSETEGGALWEVSTTAEISLPTIHGWSKMADFKPGEWKTYSNAIPVYA